MLFLKLCITWLIVGLVFTAIGTLYDIVVNKVYIGRRQLKAIFIMILLGIFTVPLTIYFLIEDIKDNIKLKNRNKFR